MWASTCIYCNKDAKLRCVTCFKEAGIEIFFCGQEHQKLAWPYHRLVCGKKAHPFVLPAFTKEEADMVYTACIDDGQDLERFSRRVRTRRLLNADNMTLPELRIWGDFVGEVPPPDITSLWYSQFAHRMTAKDASHYRGRQASIDLYANPSPTKAWEMMQEPPKRLNKLREWVETDTDPGRAEFRNMIISRINLNIMAIQSLHPA
ncbi:hypothetical protein JCM10908_000077 [Rhodotorula pacifica]|uniref:zinc finger MYND domain-containing protein n=1 Tax=Rhodotorula pacifica TaxID=1495444 RepID=UPI0031738C16